MRLAITGGTGFVGSHLIEQAVAEGHAVQALTRRPQSPQPGVTWIPGALDQPESLAPLCAGCDAVIHVAGVIKGDADAFHQGNVVGTGHIVAAAQLAGVPRFIHVSSLAAREPQLSAYGRSKRASEEPVKTSGLAWTIVRPAAIYGPRERDMLDLFRFARRGVVPVPAGVRLSIIHVRDLARLLLACLTAQAAEGRTFEPDDGRPGGWASAALARAIGGAVHRRVIAVPLPAALIRAGVPIDRLLRGSKAKLTADRAAYYCHPDWTAAAAAQPPRSLWQPHIPTTEGLAATARWYREAGWL